MKRLTLEVELSLVPTRHTPSEADFERAIASFGAVANRGVKVRIIETATTP